jgi:hypothetical protein
MLILRLPYATMIGTLIAFTALIPVAGAYIGAAVGAFMIFMVSPMQALIFLIFLVILQQLEGNLIYPKVVGTSIGLPGIWVLAAVTIGGTVANIPGMLLGVPLTASVYTILKHDLDKKLSPPPAPAKEEKPKYVPKAFGKKAEEEEAQISVFEEATAEEATQEAAPQEEAPVVVEETTSQKSTPKNRVGAMFDFLTFSDV